MGVLIDNTTALIAGGARGDRHPEAAHHRQETYHDLPSTSKASDVTGIALPCDGGMHRPGNAIPAANQL